MAIERTDGTVTDVLFSASATAPTMPATTTAADWIDCAGGRSDQAFSQWANEFQGAADPGRYGEQFGHE
jgi:hypothetical protein